MQALALTKAALCTPFHLHEEATVLIDQGKIIAAGPSAAITIPACYREVPLEGLVLAPGLIDQHLHGGGGAAVMDGEPDALIEMAKYHATHGVTSFLATTTSGSRDQLVKVAKAYARLSELQYKGAQCLGVHLEGPYLAPGRAGVHRQDTLRAPSSEEIATLHQLSGNGIRMVTMAPELPGAVETAVAIQTKGIIAAIGHSEADYEATKVAIERGFACVAHCCNQLGVLHHREPGVLGAVLADPDLPVEMIVDGQHLHPAMVQILWKLKGPEQLILISDAMPPAGLPDGSYQLPEGVIRLHQNRLENATGQLAGSVISLDAAVRNTFEILQCELTEALRMATYNPARLLGVNKSKGSVYPGKDADIIALTPDLDVVMTMVKGEVISGLISLG